MANYRQRSLMLRQAAIGATPQGVRAAKSGGASQKPRFLTDDPQVFTTIET